MLFPQFNFTVYFLAYVKDPSAVPTSGEEQWLFACRTPGCIELTWNYGTESEGPDRIYNTGKPEDNNDKFQIGNWSLNTENDVAPNMAVDAYSAPAKGNKTTS